ncbi:sensor domain-containing diguanylate cyclase [Notoacmeibacter sp. MSK16QG-6]|uniref:GGDEF domain-containing protein n=1 Tax=Notoacmeibacter sp. MSK16QG-6 TaxID=2957982 RepID=UPI00209FEBFC|nr:sensor domain-containing diguanylate cyclase [Notoacmeibacter sp. MSK16QG-6]MCP1200149.1 sensor domain-containing diguanylate cyclase [Notoacmeibacter sp. MSK16QG-6]
MFELFDCDEQGSATADITRASLVDTEDRLGIMLDAMPLGVLIHSKHAILYANAGACDLLGEERGSLIGKHFLDFQAPDTDSLAFDEAFATLGRTIEQETVIVRSKNGCERLMRVITGRLPWKGLAVVQVLLQDITDQKRAENSLRKLSITDELTGAYNRRHAFYEAGLYMERTDREASPFSIALIDIDHFKGVNDDYGHAVGDEVLKSFTGRGHRFLATSNMDSAIFARIGGEEFLILAPGCDVDAAARIAENFRSKLAASPIKTAKGPLQITASIGVAERRPDDDSFDTILNRADDALYAAKSSGRNKVAIS